MAINDGRVVSNLINQAIAGEDLTIYGNGEQTRSFCYVDDLIDGLVSLFFTENIHSPINLGNPDTITMNDLATEIKYLTNSNSKVVYHPLPQDDPIQRKPNINQAKELLNWEPKTDRKNGLTKTIDYFLELNNG
jgi:nucleoside-diphosphate-sugar epimerase